MKNNFPIPASDLYTSISYRPCSSSLSRLLSHYNHPNEACLSHYVGNRCIPSTGTTHCTLPLLTPSKPSNHLSPPQLLRDFTAPKTIMISGTSSPISRPSSPFSSHTDMDTCQTPPIPNIPDSAQNTSSTDHFHSPLAHPLTRSRTAVQNEEDKSKQNSRKRKHWQSLADDPANHNPELSKPKKKKGKKREVNQPAEKKKNSLSVERNESAPPKRENKTHRPTHNEEEEDLWKYFEEPEWEGILDVVP